MQALCSLERSAVTACVAATLASAGGERCTLPLCSSMPAANASHPRLPGPPKKPLKPGAPPPPGQACTPVQRRQPGAAWIRPKWQVLCAAAGQPGCFATPLLSRSRQASPRASVTQAPALRGQLLCAGAAELAPALALTSPGASGTHKLPHFEPSRPALTGLHSSPLPSAAASLELPAVPGCYRRWSSRASSHATLTGTA